MEARISLTAATLCVLLAGTLVYWVRPPTDGPQLISYDTPEPTEESGTRIQPAPVVASEGPFPRAIVNEPAHNDRGMITGRTYSHTFLVRNEGFAPLKLSRGKTECRCDSDAFQGTGIPPGEQAEIKVSWTAQKGPRIFEIEIQTNDPERPILELEAGGRGSKNIELSPGDPHGQYGWRLGNLGREPSAKFTGYILSKTQDEFEILGVTCSDSRLSAKISPATDEERERLDVAVKSAYRIDLEVSDLPVGLFDYELRLRTNVPISEPDPSQEVRAAVSGVRSGPLTLFGREWVPEQATISMGRIEASEGKRVSLRLLVYDLPDAELKFLNVESPDFIKVELSKSTRKENSKPEMPRYELSVTIPPLALTTTQADRQRHLIKIVTNHPDAPAFEFFVLFSH